MSANTNKVMTPVRALGLVLGMFGFALATPAFGAATGGSVLVNSVAVDYQNASGAAMTQVTASVNVTITQVYSLVWQNYGANLVVDTGSTLAPDGMTVELRNAGNGTHNVVQIDSNHANSSHGTNIGNALTYECDVNGSTFGTTCFAGNFEIFAFGIDEAQGVISGAGTGTAVIALTADLVAQIAVGDTADVNGTQYNVVAIDAAQDRVTLDDTGNTLSGDIAAGDGILHEVINFRIYNTVGSLPTTGAVFQEDHVFFFRATDDQTVPVDYDTAPGTGFFEIAVVGPGISMTKYVRNDTQNAAGTGAGCAGNELTIGTTTYSDTSQANCDLFAVANDAIEYVIQIQNAPARATTACGTGEANAGNCAGPASAVTLQDDFPAYTTLVEAGGAGVAPSVDASCDNSIEIFVGDGTELIGDNEAGATDGDIEYATGTGSIIYYYVNGDDGNNDGIGTGTGGALGVDTSVCFIYQVTVN